MILLFLNLSLAKYLLIVPSFFVQRLGNSAWIAIILKGIFASLMFLLISALYKPYVSLGFGELCRKALGKYIGGAVSIIIAAVILVRGGFLFRTLSEALRTLEAENSSIEIMAVFILIPVVICALKGFNANANICALVIPFTIVSVSALAAVLVRHFRLENIMPVLGGGGFKILESSYRYFGGFFEVIYMLIFSNRVKDFKSFRRSGLWGIGAITFLATAFTLMYCASIPYPASKYFFLPLYELTRLVKASSFLQHLEPLAVFIWAGIALCALTTAVIGAGNMISSAAGAKDEKALAPLITMIIFFIGALPLTELDVYNGYKSALNVSHIFYIAAIFLVVLIARGRKVEKA